MAATREPTTSGAFGGWATAGTAAGAGRGGGSGLGGHVALLSDDGVGFGINADARHLERALAALGRDLHCRLDLGVVDGQVLARDGCFVCDLVVPGRAQAADRTKIGPRARQLGGRRVSGVLRFGGFGLGGAGGLTGAIGLGLLGSKAGALSFLAGRFLGLCLATRLRLAAFR
jgi:hypothetical protein